MSCEACTVKFSLFKRKKQCMDCLHYFCAGCIIRRRDRVQSCDNCSMLSRRPLIKSQIIQMRTRHLRNYLEAKKVNIKGCLEKDDLVNLLIVYVNETDRLNGQSQRTTTNDTGYQPMYNNERPTYFETSRVQTGSPEENNAERRVPFLYEVRRDNISTGNESNPSTRESENVHIESRDNEQELQNEPSRENVNEINEEQNQNLLEEQRNVPETSSSSQNEEITNNRLQEVPELGPEHNPESDQMIVEDVDDLEELQRRSRNATNNRVEIEEVTEGDTLNIPVQEPVITESPEEKPVKPPLRESAAICTEIKTWPDNIKLSDIEISSDLNYLTTKQLKYLLLANRVDFKGCVERYELLDRVSRLWTEYQKSRKDAENCDVDSLCKICLDAPIECVILECGHMACCIDCGKKMAECPICRQYIVRVVRIFRS